MLKSHNKLFGLSELYFIIPTLLWQKAIKKHKHKCICVRHGLWSHGKTSLFTFLECDKVWTGFPMLSEWEAHEKGMFLQLLIAWQKQLPSQASLTRLSCVYLQSQWGRYVNPQSIDIYSSRTQEPVNHSEVIILDKLHPFLFLPDHK